MVDPCKHEEDNRAYRSRHLQAAASKCLILTDEYEQFHQNRMKKINVEEENLTRPPETGIETDNMKFNCYRKD